MPFELLGISELSPSLGQSGAHAPVHRPENRGDLLDLIPAGTRGQKNPCRPSVGITARIDHLLEDLQASSAQFLPRVTPEPGRPSHDIGPQPPARENPEGLLHPIQESRPAIGIYQNVVGADVGSPGASLHGLQHFLHLLQLAEPAVKVQHAVEDECVWLHPRVLHLRHYVLAPR